MPQALVEQLAVGGRLVIPVGPLPTLQKLVRITRESETETRREELGEVRFVPLIGAQGWVTEGGEMVAGAVGTASRPATISDLLREAAEPIHDIAEVDLGSLLERIGDARVVLLGEATHGTSEFYQMRARITPELIKRRGFTIVAVEADWPDAARVHRAERQVRVPELWRLTGVAGGGSLSRARAQARTVFQQPSLRR